MGIDIGAHNQQVQENREKLDDMAADTYGKIQNARDAMTGTADPFVEFLSTLTSTIERVLEEIYLDDEGYYKY